MSKKYDPLTGELLPESGKAAQEKSVPLVTDENLRDKKYLRDLAMKELVAIVLSNGGDIKGIAAVKELLDRSEGRAAQAVEIKATIENKEMSREEINRRVAFLLATTPIEAEYEEIK